jgi:hypothetical protein
MWNASAYEISKLFTHIHKLSQEACLADYFKEMQYCLKPSVKFLKIVHIPSNSPPAFPEVKKMWIYMSSWCSA